MPMTWHWWQTIRNNENVYKTNYRNNRRSGAIKVNEENSKWMEVGTTQSRGTLVKRVWRRWDDRSKDVEGALLSVPSGLVMLQNVNDEQKVARKPSSMGM